MAINEKTTLAEEMIGSANSHLDQAMIKIRHCLAQLTNAQIGWRPAGELNSIGNLCLHIAGNLRQWGIVPITGQRDARERASEFAAQPFLSAEEVAALLTLNVNEAKLLWNQLNDDQLTAMHSIQGFSTSLAGAIAHTSTHFVGHTHQIIFLTRLQLGESYQFSWTPEDEPQQIPI